MVYQWIGVMSMPRMRKNINSDWGVRLYLTSIKRASTGILTALKLDFMVNNGEMYR